MISFKNQLRIGFFVLSNTQDWTTPGPDPVRHLHVNLRHDGGLLRQRPDVQHPALLRGLLLGRNHALALCSE